MTVDWRAQRAAVNDALAGATPTQVELAGFILARLRQVSGRYDTLFPPAPAANTPTTLVESAAHETWRETLSAKILDLHSLAAVVDGGEVPESVHSHTRGAWDAVLARLANASHLSSASAGERAICTRARENVRIDEEPRFYVDAYYADSNGTMVGEYEQRMADVLEEIAIWLDVVETEEEIDEEED